MEAVCGSPGPHRWDGVCVLDLVSAVTGATHVCLTVVLSAVWWRYREPPPPGPPLRFRRHSLRWALTVACALTSLAALLDASLGEWYSDTVHPHVLLAPAVALVACASVIQLAGASERDSAPARLLLNVVFFVVSVVLRILKVRFYFGVPGISSVHVRFLVNWGLLVVYALMLVVEISFFVSEGYLCSRSKYSPESFYHVDMEQIRYRHPYASARQKVTFSWVTDLLWIGFKRPIGFEDLGSLPPGQDTQTHFEKFNKVLKREKARCSATGRRLRLWRVVWRAHRGRLLLGGLLKLFGDLVGFVAPLALKNIIEFVLLHQSGQLELLHLQQGGYLYPTVGDFLSNGYVMSVVALVAALAQGTFSQCGTHVMVTEGLRLRSEVQALVYDKSLRIPLTTMEATPGGSTDTLQSLGSATSDAIRSAHIDSGSMISLLSEDAASLTEMMSQLHYTWAIPLKIVVLLVLIHQQLGLSAVYGALLSIFVITPLQFVVVKQLQSNKKVLQTKSDERLSLTAEFIAGIRLLKLNALEFIYQQKIEHVRKRELRLLLKDSLFWALNTFLTQASLTVVTLTTFGLYGYLEERPLVSSRVFSGLALFNQLTVPLFQLPMLVKAIIDARVSAQRLRHFLAMPEVESITGGAAGRNSSPHRTNGRHDGVQRPHAKLAGVDSSSTATTGSRASSSASWKERPRSLEISPAPSSPWPGSPAAWGSQDSVFALENIPEGDEEVIVAEESDASSGEINETSFSGTEDVPGEDESGPDDASDKAQTTSESAQAALAGSLLDGDVTTEENTSTLENPPSNPNGVLPSDADSSADPIVPRTPLQLQGVRFAPSTLPGRQGLLANVSSSQPEEALPVVTVTDACFCWRCGDTDGAQLYDISLSVPRGKLTMVVGGVGSGKSSLVAALLGEMHRHSGSVTWARGASLAYASQSPWLFNDSLRNNVLFGRAPMPRRYRRVLAACALQDDIKLLPHEDRELIGEQGIVLSGGQRQRVAVARALYSNADVVILDDPLSALDVHVGSHLFNNGIRKLLQKENRTVILVTHKLQYLEQADLVIALERGRIRQQGSLAEIKAADPELYGGWQQLIRQDRDLETQLAETESKTAKERWRLLRIRQKSGALPGLGLSRDKFSSFRSNAIRRQASLRHHLSHGAPLSLAAAGGGNLMVAPQRRWTTTDRRTVSPRARLASIAETARRHLSYGRSSSLRPATPLTPATPDDEEEKKKKERLALSRMMSSPPNMPSPIQRGSNLSIIHKIMRRNTTTRHTPSTEDVRETSLDQVTPLMTESPPLPPPPKRPSVARAVSIASNYDAQINEEEEGVAAMLTSSSDVDGRRLSIEDRETGKLSKRLYFTYLQACGMAYGLLYIIMVLCTQGAHVGMDYWLSVWSDAASQWNRTHQQQWSLFLESQLARSAVLPENVTTAYERFVAGQTRSYLLVYGGLAAAAVVLALVANLSGQWAGARARTRLQHRLLAAVTRGRMEFFDRTPAGRIIDRFSRDISFIDKKLATAIHLLLYFVLQCVTAIIVNAVVTWWFILIAAVILAIYYFLQKFYRAFAIELQRLDSIARSPVLSHFAETQTGLAVVRAFGHQRRFSAALQQCADLHLLTTLTYQAGQRWLGIALDYLGAVIVFISSLTAVTVAVRSQDVPSSLVGLAINYTLLIPMYLVWVVRSLSDVEMYMCAVERVHKYTNLKTEHYRKQNIAAPGWPQRGKIQFVDATVGYGADAGELSSTKSNSPLPCSDQNTNTKAATPVLKDVNVTIQPGQKVALVGRSGSGKSTLVMTLFQMTDLLSGEVRIDGKDLTKLPLLTIRSQLALIPQEPLLFSGTVRSNMDPRCDMKDEKIWHALEMVQLKEYVSGLGKGLESEVQEGGDNFSVGQRQLFCLARALLREARVVVMDEPTSALDGATERSVTDIVTRAFASSTVITIAHQLSTVRRCDLVLVLHEGRVAEQGSPAQLAAKKDGIYAGMLRAAQEQGGSLTDGIE